MKGQSEIDSYGIYLTWHDMTWHQTKYVIWHDMWPHSSKCHIGSSCTTMWVEFERSILHETEAIIMERDWQSETWLMQSTRGDQDL